MGIIRITFYEEISQEKEIEDYLKSLTPTKRHAFILNALGQVLLSDNSISPTDISLPCNEDTLPGGSPESYTERKQQKNKKAKKILHEEARKQKSVRPDNPVEKPVPVSVEIDKPVLPAVDSSENVQLQPADFIKEESASSEIPVIVKSEEKTTTPTAPTVPEEPIPSPSDSNSVASLQEKIKSGNESYSDEELDALFALGGNNI